jgi:hypothetical protein
MEQKPSYIMPALTNAIIVGVGLTVISLIVTYSTIGGEPTGSMFGPLTFMQFGVCLIGSIAGILTVKGYAKMDGVELTLGNGAVIGLVTGLFLAVVITLLSYVWNNMIDPSLMDTMKNYMVNNMEMFFEKSGAMSGDALDQMLGEVEKSFEEQKTMMGILKGFGYSVLGLGIVNLISGMITAKVTAKD